MTFPPRLLAPALLALSAPAAWAAPPAEEVASAFCAALRAGDEAAAVALMTAELQAGIAALRAADAAFRTAHPDEKPPLGDGLRLATFPDGLEDCTAEAVTADGAVLLLVPGGDPAAAWRDRLVLVPAPDGGLLVADILYAPGDGAGFSAWLAESAAWK